MNAQQLPRNESAIASEVESKNTSAFRFGYPKVLGHYRLLNEIGEGEMSVVHQAQHLASRELVALKIVTPHIKMTETLGRTFLRDAGMLCSFSHKRIVQCIEVGVAGEHLFLAMEYIAKINPERMLSTISFLDRVKIACGIVRQVLDGLEYAHGPKLVYLDVKPRSLLTYKEHGKLQTKLPGFSFANSLMMPVQTSAAWDTTRKANYLSSPPNNS